MKYQIFSENEWVFPDSKIEKENCAELHSARGADVCFQVLTDMVLQGGEKLEVAVENLGCEAQVYQLLPACVNANSAPDLGTTLDYEAVKDYVIRQAPYDIYDITYLPEEGTLKAGRAAFYVRLNIAADAAVGAFDGSVTLTIGEESWKLPVSLKIYNTQIPTLDKAQLRMVNWIYYDKLADHHNVAMQSDEYFEILDRYME